MNSLHGVIKRSLESDKLLNFSLAKGLLFYKGKSPFGSSIVQ